MDVDKGCLPSPEDLKYKILIKAKRSKKVDKEEKNGSEVKSPLEETMKMAKRISVVISRGPSPDETLVKDEENCPVEKNGLDEENPPNDENVRGETNAISEENGPDDNNASDTENPPDTKNPPDQKSCNGNSIQQKGLENGSDELSSSDNTTSTFDESSDGNSGHRDNEQNVIVQEKTKDIDNPVENVSGELNSIINCLEATKFVELDDPDRKFWQMFSLKENPAEVLGNKQESAMKLVALTQRGLARVYPASTRVDSSNYNPIPFWMR